MADLVESKLTVHGKLNKIVSSLSTLIQQYTASGTFNVPATVVSLSGESGELVAVYCPIANTQYRFVIDGYTNANTIISPVATIWLPLKIKYFESLIVTIHGNGAGTTAAIGNVILARNIT